MNRKKNVTGQASGDSMKTSGQGRGEGPVGARDGYQERKNQALNSLREGLNRAQQPFSRPKNPSGQAGQSTMHTSGAGQNQYQAQQQRPSGAQQAPQRPQSFQQTSQRPQTFQQTGSSSSSGNVTRGGGSKLILIVIAAVLLLGGGGGLSGLFGGGDGGDTTTLPSSGTTGTTSSSSSTSGGSVSGSASSSFAASSSSASDLINALLGGEGGNGSTSGNSSTNNNYSYNNSNSSGNSGTYGASGSYGSSTSGSTYGSTYGTAGSSAFGSSSAGTSISSLLGGGSSGSSLLSSLLGGSWYSGQTGYGAAAPAASAGTSTASSSPTANYGAVNRTVAKGSRDKYTVLKGNGKDTMTVMVYMCGADLESKSAMGTKDLQEMVNAKFGSKVRLIVFTGGSTNWRNNLVSSQVNQVWQVKDGNLNCLVQNAGTASMTNPDTLASFIQYCAKNFSANRYALILWDHGSGSVSGYGYDEKNPRTGSMSLAGLNSAFQAGGVKFDFIGFDACLMATVENALMASKYADYLIASEETEPGIGWYYTNWLTALGSNSSMDTLDIGKQIIDDFVSTCSSQCRGQQTTLSITDLAELEHTVPKTLTAFSQSVSSLISNKEYKTVSNARNGSREFATSARIDQVDLSDLCDNLGTKESASLAKALRGAVKYNRINNISDAYGLSVYFPYQRTSNVDKAVSTYAAIGMDESYAEAIRAFASVEASGQYVSGGGSPIPSLFGGSSYGGSSSASADMIGELLSAFLGGGSSGFLSGRNMTDADMQQYLTLNMLDASALRFQQDGDSYVLDLPAEQWALVHGADLNIFYDNGDGYVDLGLDNVFEFDDQGRMVADTQGTWLAINSQPVAYYHETSEYVSDTEWRITGRVPALLNGSRVELLVVFDQDHENGYIAGARSVYDQEVTETVAKAMEGLNDGDTLVFLADLYDYDQQFNDSYPLGNPVTVQGDLVISDMYLPDASKVMATYRFTDLYNQAYWTPVIGQ